MTTNTNTTTTKCAARNTDGGGRCQRNATQNVNGQHVCDKHVTWASEPTEQGTQAPPTTDSILATAATMDEDHARAAFTSALVALESVESGYITGTIDARRAIGAVCERFYVLAHGESAPSLSALVKSVPADVLEGRSESFIKLCVRTNRLHTPERYRTWSDACGTDAATSDPASFRRNADAYLRWAEAQADGRTTLDGSIVAKSAKSNRSGTGDAPAGETPAMRRERVAAEQASQREHTLKAAQQAGKIGSVSVATFQRMTDDNLTAVIILCQTLVSERDQARKDAEKVKRAAEKGAVKSAPSVDTVAGQMADMSAADLTALLARAADLVAAAQAK